VRKADNLTTFMCRFSRNSGSLNLQEPSGPVQACNGTALPFICIKTVTFKRSEMTQLLNTGHVDVSI
jgi:hypothetical protein